MIGNGYWATGITVKWSEHYGWIAHVDFYDDGFAEDGSTEGTLRCRYWSKDHSEDALARQIDLVKADAERLGITFATLSFAQTPLLYYQGDGEDPEWPPPPDWREILGRQATRLGWRGPYVEGGGS